jgi:hypothetical protein
MRERIKGVVESNNENLIIVKIDDKKPELTAGKRVTILWQ